MKKSILAFAVLAAAASGWASAQDHAGPHPGRKLDEPPSLTRQQFIQREERRFDEMDANKDGTVTPDEMRAFRAKRLGQHEGHGQPPHDPGAEHRPPPPANAGPAEPPKQHPAGSPPPQSGKPTPPPRG